MKIITSHLCAGAVIASLAVLAWGSVLSSFGSITVYATPVVSSGTSGACPGGYVGYVTYKKTIAQGWGWAPTNTVHTITDTNRTDTKIEFTGKLNDSGCNQTTVSVPHPTASTKYQFTVYFTSNVPTGSYPLVLTGFSQ